MMMKVCAFAVLALAIVVDSLVFNDLSTEVSAWWALLFFPILLALSLSVLLISMALRFILSTVIIAALVLISRHFFYANDTMFWPVAYLTGGTKWMVTFATLLTFQWVARLPK